MKKKNTQLPKDTKICLKTERRSWLERFNSEKLALPKLNYKFILILMKISSDICFFLRTLASWL